MAGNFSYIADTTSKQFVQKKPKSLMKTGKVHTISVDGETKIVKVIFNFPKDSMEDRQSCMQIVGGIMIEHGYSRLLMDMRIVEDHMSVVEQLEVAGRVMESPMTRAKAAVVISSEANNPNLHINDKGRATGRNIAEFIDMDKATAWLLEEVK